MGILLLRERFWLGQLNHWCFQKGFKLPWHEVRRRTYLDLSAWWQNPSARRMQEHEKRWQLHLLPWQRFEGTKSADLLCFDRQGNWPSIHQETLGQDGSSQLVYALQKHPEEGGSHGCCHQPAQTSQCQVRPWSLQNDFALKASLGECHDCRSRCSQHRT